MAEIGVASAPTPITKKHGLHKNVSDSIVFSIATMPSSGNTELAAFFAFVVTCVLWSLENRIL